MWTNLLTPKIKILTNKNVLFYLSDNQNPIKKNCNISPLAVSSITSSHSNTHIPKFSKWQWNKIEFIGVRCSAKPFIIQMLLPSHRHLDRLPPSTTRFPCILYGPYNIVKAVT